VISIGGLSWGDNLYNCAQVTTVLISLRGTQFFVTVALQLNLTIEIKWNKNSNLLKPKQSSFHLLDLCNLANTCSYNDVFL
jgi:hypothetical protein